MLNVDTNTLESPFHDLDNLPSDVVSPGGPLVAPMDPYVHGFSCAPSSRGRVPPTFINWEIKGPRVCEASVRVCVSCVSLLGSWGDAGP